MTRPSRFRPLACALLACAFALGAPAHAQKGDTVRPEVGKPLQAAQALVKARKGREALAEVAKAEAASGRTAYENFLIHQMRASAALAASDYGTAIKAYEAILASGRVSGGEQTRAVKTVADLYYREKDYGKAAAWYTRYFKEGGNDQSAKTFQLQSYYLSNDCSSVARMVNANAKAGEEELQMLANCFLRQNDNAGYVGAIEKLVVQYPKKQYWTDLLARVQKKPGFSDRLGANVYRLRLATGNLAGANDYMEMAQLAVQAGVPAEAKAIIDKGYEAGALGKGDQAERHGRLRALVDKSLAESRTNRARDEREALAAKDGNQLVTVGLNYVYEGEVDKGLKLIDQGMRKGGLRRPEDAKLRLGEALFHAGRKQRAVQTMGTVRGNDGTGDLARLWVLHARA